MPENADTARGGILKTRILLGLGVGLAVFVTAIIAAWIEIADTERLRLKQFKTQFGLVHLADEIQAYTRRLGSPPQSLQQLYETDNAPKPAPGSWVFLDGWERPFIYSVDNQGGLATSYGRDGRPGGAGLDCDLTSRDPVPHRSFPTFRQFLFEMPTQGMVYSCACSGVLAFLLCLYLVSPPFASLRDWLVLAVELIAVLGATLIIGVFMSILHIPLGH